MNKPISLAFVITNLDCGGAEVMLFRLLSRLDRSRFTPQVISLIDIGQIGKQIQALGIPVRTLGMQRGRPSLKALIQLVQWLRQDRPHVVQTWMYHADLMGGLAARLAGGIPTIWGVHQSDLSWAGNRILTLLTVKACAYVSRWIPKQIICCSEASRRAHGAVGYAIDKLITIPNGYDVDTFKPDLLTGTMVRQELGIPEDVTIIGMVARFHPQKDHINFFKAARILLGKRRDICFLLCGQDITWDNKRLTVWIAPDEYSHFRLIGQRDDIHRVTASFDIATLSSFGEAFPNVISEAMSCAVPCVVTDVGDAALIVGQTGVAVPPRDPKALEEGWQRILGLDLENRMRLGLKARQRIKEQFNLSKIVTRYESVFEKHGYCRNA